MSQEQSTDFIRYLGIAVHPHSFAFVVIEDKIALDSGARACDHSQFDACLGERLTRILRTYTPGLIVVLVPDADHINSTVETIANTIVTAARQRAIRTARIGSAVMRRYFGQHYQASTKYEIAQAVANVLPELAWELPPKRKLWRGEHYRMSIFEAAAGVIAKAML